MLANSVLRLIFRFPWGKRAGGKRAVSSGIGGIAWDCNDIDLLLLVSSLMILVLFRLFYHFPSSTSLSFRQQGQKMNRTLVNRAYAFSPRKRQNLQSNLWMSAVVAHASSNGGKASVTEQTDDGIA